MAPSAGPSEAGRPGWGGETQVPLWQQRQAAIASSFIHRRLRASSLTPVVTELHHCYVKNAAASPAAILQQQQSEAAMRSCRRVSASAQPAPAAGPYGCGAVAM